MIGLIDTLTRPLMRMLDPENAHRLAVKALRFAPLAPPRAEEPSLAVRACGLNFPNPIGMAAGFDMLRHAERVPSHGGFDQAGIRN